MTAVHSRRTILKSLAATAALAAPTAAIAGPTENSKLLALGKRLDEAEMASISAITAHQEALARFAAIGPALPAALIVNRKKMPWARQSAFSIEESDAEGKTVYYSTHAPARRVFTSDGLRAALQFCEGRGQTARTIRWRLPIAIRYERDRAAAIKKAGIAEAADAKRDAALNLERITIQIFQAEADTTQGLVIQARALALANDHIGWDEGYHAVVFHGRQLAATVMRVFRLLIRTS